MNFEPLLTLPGRAARSACIGRIRRGHQGRSFDQSSARARPQLPRRCEVPIAQSLPSPRVPKIASGTPACAAHASYACMHPIPTAHRHTCSPRCPPHPHFLAPCGAPQSIPQPPTALMPRAAPPWRQTMNLESIMAYVSRFDGWCGATRGGFSFSRSFLRSQMCRVGRRRRGPWRRRVARPDIFCCFCVGECFVRVLL